MPKTLTCDSTATRVAMLSVHTSPLAQPGIGDAGGMNVYITELSKALAHEGVAVEIFTRRTSSREPDRVELSDGVLVHHITAGPFEGLHKEDLPSQLCYFTQGVLRTEAGRTPGWYDIVHSHYWLSGEVGWLAADRWNVPLAHSMHTMARVKNAQLAPGDTPEPRLRILGEEQVVSEAHALVANTEHEARELIEYYDADPHRVHVVPPGVDLTTFSDLSPQGLTRDQERARHGFTPNDNVVVFAGRIQPLKGADVLVQMLGELAHGQQARREQGATDDVQAPQLVILGGASGKESALDDLKRLVHALGVGRQVRFEPPCTREELAAWFRVADVVAMPSRNESFGLVAVEAQACGTPVIAAEVGGLRTAVRHGESGLLIPNHDPVTWAQETRRFFSDPELRERLAANARSVAATFTWQHAAKATLEVYDGVIKERTKIS